MMSASGRRAKVMGKTGEKNYGKALELYTAAAEQGNATAQHNLGLAYYYGRGTDKDYEKAAYWFKKSAEQGYTNAQYRMGDIYYSGKCCPKNFKKAEYWLRKAAWTNNFTASSIFLLTPFPSS